MALIQNPEHAEDVRQVGAEPAVVDLEHASETDVTQAIAGAEAVVFAAGAGLGAVRPARRRWTTGALWLIAAAKQAGVRRYVIEQMGADPDAPGDDTFSVYLRAKGGPMTRCGPAAWMRLWCVPAG